MATNTYNGLPATVEVIATGTRLYRIYPADATYDANSFNPSPRPLGDTRQGRFEPVDATLGAYLYASPTLAGAVAEGVLRNVTIPKSGIVRLKWLQNKHLAVLELREEIAVASVYGRHTARLNLDSAVLCGNWTQYNETRRIGTQILLNTTNANGIRYRCRNNDDETSLLLIDRGGTPPALTVGDEWDILGDPVGREQILTTLDQHFGLQYTGTV